MVIIHLPELDRWLINTTMLLRNLEGEAKLTCVEPTLSVVFKSELLGHVTLEVSITPNHMTQSQLVSVSNRPELPAAVRHAMSATIGTLPNL